MRAPDESAIVEVTRSASNDVTGCIGKAMGGAGGNAHYEYGAATAAPWMSFMKAMCMISSLFTRNTSIQENIR
eukprot:2081050-Pyramimonas_sp.AAC.1